MPLLWLGVVIHALNHICETSAASTMLQRAATLFPQDNRILARRVLHSLTNRQPIMGRRLALLERLHKHNGWNVLIVSVVIKILHTVMKMVVE